MDPRPRLFALAQQAGALHRSMTETAVSRAARPVLRRTASGFVGGILREAGLPVALARLGGQAAVQHIESGQAEQLRQSYDAWSRETRVFLETISVASPRMSTTGNSARLLSQFTTSQGGSRLATKLKEGEKFLEKLLAKELVYNSEILECLRAKKVQAQLEKQRRAELALLDIPSATPGLDILRFPNRAALHEALKEYPNERTSLEGAMDAFMGNAQDRFRHTIAGARVALEGMAQKITGTNDWKPRIQEVANEETRRLFSATWSYLSSMGSHAGRVPTEYDAELGLKNVIVLVGWLMKNKVLFEHVNQGVQA